MAIVGVTGDPTIAGRTASEWVFFGIVALLFAGSVTATVAWSISMSAMPMSMAWTPICGRAWFGTAVAFLGMWMVMMVAMMLPSLVPMLLRYRAATREAADAVAKIPPGVLSALVGIGYFVVWGVLGIFVFAVGATLAMAEIQYPALARVAPHAVGPVVLVAGALQFKAWKARHLACCRTAPAILSADAGTAWRHGVRLGLHCSFSCVGPTAILLAVGIMDLPAMAVVAGAIALERLAPAGQHVARATGSVALGVGLLLIARAVGLG